MGSCDVGMRGRLKLESVVKVRLQPVPPPSLLIQLEPWHRVFFRNFRDLLWPRRQPPLLLSSRPAPYWDDVFVASRLPWGKFAESAAAHVALVAGLWGFARIWPQRPHLVSPPAFHTSDVAYYDASEYLPPLDTGRPKETAPPQKGDPAFAPQPIISVPPEPDNRKQTIVSPPQVRLNTDVPLPNLVAWAHPATAISPTVAASPAPNLKLPTLPVPVVAPAPEVSKSRLDAAPTLSDSVVAPAPQLDVGLSKRRTQFSQPAIVEPPPSVEAAATRRISDINIGPSTVVAPAPELPMSAQRALPNAGSASFGGSGAAAVPPPPSVQGTGGTSQDGRLIALSVNPAPPGSVEPPNGNRRGTFAATPEGKAGAVGTPETAAGSLNGRAGNHPGGSGSGGGSGKNPFSLPSGLLVGPGSRPGSSTSGGSGQGSQAGDPPLVASATPPRINSAPRHRAAEMPEDLKTEAEKRVFGPRRFYAMTLNVPNLNSAGGSWVMHFAEAKDEETPGELLAPVATRAVDPGYPLELMKQNVQGTVTLSAVIQSDGSVGNVTVVNGIDDQLDEYARKALGRWKFLPALRDGNPVALQAVVVIPFRSMQKKTGF